MDMIKIGHILFEWIDGQIALAGMNDNPDFTEEDNLKHIAKLKKMREDLCQMQYIPTNLNQAL